MLVTPADAKNIDKVLKLIGKEPEEVVLEGVDFAAIKDTPRPDRKSSRERPSGRGRSRDVRAPREAQSPPQTEVPAARSETRAIEAPVVEEREPEVRVARPAARDVPRSRPEPTRPRRREDRKEAESQDTPVVGFGTDLPAFLSRPTTSGRK